ncbi:MAG: hypothetical protein EZS28_012817, partial [Streblomastix strix]
MASSVVLKQWYGIVTQSFVIGAVSSLMFKTENPQIRNICGAVLQVLQLRGTEMGEIIDWKILIQPLVSLLFNPDKLISELGKQTILEGINKKPEILQQLVDIGFPERNLLSEAKDIISQEVLINILEVVLVFIQNGILNQRQTAKLRIAVEKLKQRQQTQSIDLICTDILQQSEQTTKIRTDQELQLDLEEKLQNKEEQLQEAQYQIKNEQERTQNAEQKAENAEENQKIAEEKLQTIETQISEQPHKQQFVFKGVFNQPSSDFPVQIPPPLKLLNPSSSPMSIITTSDQLHPLFLNKVHPMYFHKLHPLFLNKVHP